MTYDNVGNLTGYNDGITSAVYGYDESYRKVSEAVDYGDFALTNAITYYDDGRKKTFTGPDSVAYQYQYDTGGRLSGVQIPNVGFVTIGEYNWNRPTTVTLPGGTKKEYEYDPLMRVKRITSSDPGQNVFLNYDYTRDKMDNITDKGTEHGEYGYEYDDLYRLTTADNPAQDDEAFTYDTVGNRLTAADTTGDWAYNQNNELGGYDAVSYEYDANGNMVKKTVGAVITSYVFNTEDRLTEVRDGNDALIASYYYDPFGRRLWKEVSGVRTYFHYADEGLIGEYDSTGNEIKTYGYKPNSIFTTDPLFMKVGTNYYFYHTDHLGTPQKMTAVNGAIVWAAKYSSFGKANVDVSSTITNNLRFAGQYEDEETGLHYNWFRFYDPGTGRYLRVDPIGMRGGINLFIYALNNPENYIDPLGLLVPPKCMNECCENCEHKEVIRNKRTGETKTKDEYYWDEILRIHALAAWTAYAAISGIPTPPPTYHEHVIGKRYYLERWVEEKCIREICKDFMTYPIYECQEIEGSEYWAGDAHQKPEDIRRKFFY